MVVRAVEWKLPYTGWKAIEITNRKVVNLRLRDENNLIIYDAGDNEIYTDLQLWDEIRPSSEFPVWANVGRAIEDNGWDTTGTLVCFKTTSGDNIKLLYADNWKLFIDNGTWTFKQIYLKSEVDALLALKQDLLTAGEWIEISEENVISCTKEWIENTVYAYYETTNNRWELEDWTVDDIKNNTVIRFSHPAGYKSIWTIYDTNGDEFTFSMYHHALWVDSSWDLVGIVKEVEYEDHTVYVFYDWYGGGYSIQ